MPQSAASPTTGSLRTRSNEDGRPINRAYTRGRPRPSPDRPHACSLSYQQRRLARPVPTVVSETPHMSTSTAKSAATDQPRPALRKEHTMTTQSSPKLAATANRTSAGASSSHATRSAPESVFCTACASTGSSALCRGTLSSSSVRWAGPRTDVLGQRSEPKDARTQYDVNDRTAPAPWGLAARQRRIGHERDLGQTARSHWRSGGAGEVLRGRRR